MTGRVRSLRSAWLAALAALDRDDSNQAVEREQRALDAYVDYCTEQGVTPDTTAPARVQTPDGAT